MNYKYNASPEECMSGDLDAAILVRQGKYIAWTKTKEGPARPDLPAAKADLKDFLLSLKTKS